MLNSIIFRLRVSQGLEKVSNGFYWAGLYGLLFAFGVICIKASSLLAIAWHSYFVTHNYPAPATFAAFAACVCVGLAALIISALLSFISWVLARGLQTK